MRRGFWLLTIGYHSADRRGRGRLCLPSKAARLFFLLINSSPPRSFRLPISFPIFCLSLPTNSVSLLLPFFFDSFGFLIFALKIAHVCNNLSFFSTHMGFYQVLIFDLVPYLCLMGIFVCLYAEFHFSSNFQKWAFDSIVSYVNVFWGTNQSFNLFHYLCLFKPVDWQVFWGFFIYTNICGSSDSI